MNTMYSLLLFCAFMWTTPSPALYGKWQLQKVTVENQLMVPKVPLFLTILSDEITYNLPVNKCRSVNFELSDHHIRIHELITTELGGDLLTDSIAAYVYYSGNYALTGDTLVISDGNKVMRLQRVP